MRLQTGLVVRRSHQWPSVEVMGALGVPSNFDAQTGDRKLGTVKSVTQLELTLLPPMYPVSPVFFDERESGSERETGLVLLLFSLANLLHRDSYPPISGDTLTLSKKDWGYWVHWGHRG